MLRAIAALFVGLLLCAQTPMLPGFPPGTFQNRAALDATTGGGGGTPAFKWINQQNNGFLSSATSTNIGSTNQSGACGTISAGDTLVAGLTIQNETSDTITPAAGWTQIGTTQTVGGAITAFYYKIAGGSETCSYTFSWTGAGCATSCFSNWVLYSANGTNGSTPVDVSLTSTSATGGGTTITADPSNTLSATGSNDLLVLFITTADTSAVLTANPGGMTNRINVQQESGTAMVSVSDQQLVASGTIGNRTASGATGKSYIYLMLALKS